MSTRTFSIALAVLAAAMSVQACNKQQQQPAQPSAPGMAPDDARPGDNVETTPPQAPVPGEDVTEPGSAPGTTTTPNGGETSQAAQPKDWIVIQTEAWVPVVDGVGRHLQSAQLAFQQGDRARAAKHLRQGAAALKREQPGMSTAAAQRLAATATALDGLADRLEQNAPVSARELDKTLASAHRANARDRWRYLAQDEWVALIDRPDLHFRNAQQAMSNRSFDQAADEIRKGTAFLRMQVHQVGPEQHWLLLTSGEQLDWLADDLDAGILPAAQEIDGSFALANRAMARAHYAQTLAALEQNRLTQAGRHLDASALYFERSLEWAGQAQVAAPQSALNDIRALARDWIEGKQPAAKRSASVLQRFGKELEQAGLPRTGTEPAKGTPVARGRS